VKAVIAIPIGLLLLPILALGGLSKASVDDPIHFTSRSQLIGQVLSSPAIKLPKSAERDVKGGLVDDRVLQVLLIAATQHSLRVGPFVTGHSYFVAGTNRVSNHVFGRAVDITMVDGRAVSNENVGAHDLVRTFLALQSPLRASEVGSPWRFDAPGIRCVLKGHQDHLHWGVNR
jgi:hypothetical protein